MEYNKLSYGRSLNRGRKEQNRSAQAIIIDSYSLKYDLR